MRPRRASEAPFGPIGVGIQRSGLLRSGRRRLLLQPVQDGIDFLKFALDRGEASGPRFLAAIEQHPLTLEKFRDITHVGSEGSEASPPEGVFRLNASCAPMFLVRRLSGRCRPIAAASTPGNSYLGRLPLPRRRLLRSSLFRLLLFAGDRH